MASARIGKSAGRISRAGRCIISKARRRSRIAFTRRRRAAGSGRSSSARMTAARPGITPGSKPGGFDGPGRYAQRREQQVCLRGRSRHAQVVRRHAASVGVQAHLAHRTVAHRSGHGLRGRGGRGDFQNDRRRQDVEGTVRLAQRQGASLATGRGRHGGAYDHPRSEESRSASTSPSRRRARSARMTAARRGSRSIAGLKSQYELPDPDAEVGHCVHRIAMHPSRPDVLFMQKHWDVLRTDNAGDQWSEVSGNLPTDFGFPIDVHAHEPETIYVVPITSDSVHYPPDGKLRVYRSKTGGNEWEALTKGLPQKDCYVNVLRDAMAVDSLDRLRHLFRHDGRTGLLLAGWRQFLECHRARSAGGLSVEVQTLK